MRNSRFSLLALAVSASLTGHVFAQNDDCTGAISVINGPNGPYTNVGSSTSAPAWPCGAGANDVWFVFVSGGTGSLTADTCGGATYDSTIEIFDGAAGCGALVSLGCNDDSCGLQSSLTVTVNPGTYFIRVGGFGGSTGSFTLNVNGPTGTGTIATNTSLGAGCVASFTSFYESFATSAAFDLANTSITMLPTGLGYIALPGVSPFLAPSATAAVVTLGDDTEAAVALTSAFPYPGGTAASLTVCSNGYVSVATGNGTAFTPSTATLLNGLQTGYYNWHDYNPSIAGSGQVKFEEVGGIAYITWDGVWDYGGTAASANTFQFQFDSASGAVHLVFQTMSTGGNARLVGYSPGGPSANPGNTDISVALPGTITLGANDILPLALGAGSRPVTGTNWNLNVSNVPATGIIGVDVIGFADPGLNDLGFLGLPGCGLRASLDILLAWLPAGATHAYGLAIPANPALVNLHLFTTSVVFQPGVNPFGAITANGIDGKIGDL